jgi:hypothetical protein
MTALTSKTFRDSLYRQNAEETFDKGTQNKILKSNKQIKRTVNVKGGENAVFIITDTPVLSQMTSCEIRGR